MSTLLMMDHVPSLNVAYAKVVSDERKQTVSNVHDNLPESAVGFAASGSAQGRTNWSSGGDVRMCGRCGKKGHVKEECFDLHGWSDSFNSAGRDGQRSGRSGRGGGHGSRGGHTTDSGGRGFAANVSGSQQSSAQDINDNDRGSAPTLTDEQWQQFISAIKSAKPTNFSSDQTFHGPHFGELDWSGGAV
ncbi:uncharacterized protein LOC110687108 [Chenopodium quinoa]|uniref:uncharacterized protein LOC110687108 n=1 Tax=Chenopodium quinoa TaxID=63459 RepID=UPI000B791072|nr:uncharacterized protein LOC110687108 [Chenopodium quinoa]